MKVSVIIPASGDRPSLRDCLRSLYNQTRLPDEIIVVSLRSIDQITKEFTLVKTLSQKERSIGEARNIAIMHSIGDVLCFTSDDCIADPNWIKTAVRLHMTHKEHMGICGRIIDRSNKPLFHFANDLIWREMEHFNQVKARLMFPGKTGLTVSAGGENLTYKRQLFESYRFDPELEGAEDFGLNSNLALDGRPLLFSEDLIIYHHNTKTTLSSFMRQYYTYGKGMMHLHRNGGFRLGIYPTNPIGYALAAFSVVAYPFYMLGKYRDLKTVRALPLLLLKELAYRSGQVSFALKR